MNTKTFFAAGLIAAAASAIKSIDATHADNVTAKTHDLNAPRVKLGGPYWTTRPYYPSAPEPKEKSDGASTDDDRYSSSDSDSVSSSDEHLETEPESVCERDGDIYACLRKQKADQCLTTQNFNADTCLCNEKYTCRDLADAYGASTCPAQNYGLTPYTSPLDNCACQSQAEYDAMYNYEWAGHCSHAPAFKKSLPKVNKIRVCNSETDSDSDCVKIGNLRRQIKGSYHNKQRDDIGHVDSSIYTDSDCDPRYSSCDTNSNEEYSNTDSDTQSVQSEKIVRKADPIRGSLADRYARKYGVKLREPAPEPKKHHGYGHQSKVIDTRSFDTDSDITSYDRSNPGELYVRFCKNDDVLSCASSLKGEYDTPRYLFGRKEYGENYTQDENRSNVDDCDSDDIAPGCNKPAQPESERYTHESHETESSGYPSKGTSNSSNSTNDPFSDSESLGDSSDTLEEVVEEPKEDLCGQVWFEPANGSDVWGWANLSQPAEGTYAGNTLITAKLENLEGIGIHGFHVHEFGDLSKECKATGAHYLPDGERIGELQDYATLRASWRDEASYYSWNPVVKLDGDYDVTGRSIVVHALDGTRVACGVIKPGCSPCADGKCKQPTSETKKVKKTAGRNAY